ncbi:MAG: hypothetical protein AAF483_15555 [Planctomycetota bacterium]
MKISVSQIRLVCILSCLAFAFINSICLNSAKADSILIGQNGGGTVVPFFGATDLQEVYEANLFTSGAMNINALSFFRQAGNSGSDIDAVTYKIHLAVTTADSSTLSSDLSANLAGLTLHTFFDGTLNKTSGYTGTEALTFNGSAFGYDPSQGNLFLWVEKSSDPSSGGDLVIQATTQDAGQAMASNFTNRVENFGLVTSFTFDSFSVPEPSCLGILAASLAVLPFRRRRN